MRGSPGRKSTPNGIPLFIGNLPTGHNKGGYNYSLGKTSPIISRLSRSTVNGRYFHLMGKTDFRSR